MILSFLNLFIILGVLVGVVYFLKGYLKKKNINTLRGSEYITVIDEGISVSVGQKLSIIQVNKECLLMTYGPNGVAFEKLEGQAFEDKLKNKEKWEEELKKSNKKQLLNLKETFGSKNGKKGIKL